jgi:hypothetical protein
MTIGKSAPAAQLACGSLPGRGSRAAWQRPGWRLRGFGLLRLWACSRLQADWPGLSGDISERGRKIH